MFDNDPLEDLLIYGLPILIIVIITGYQIYLEWFNG